jgi:hypothetical protein
MRRLKNRHERQGQDKVDKKKQQKGLDKMRKGKTRRDKFGQHFDSRIA